MESYCYSADLVSRYSDLWIEHLGHLRHRANVRMLEIGSYEGRSANWFLENILTGQGSSIVCVDQFVEPCGERFDRNIRASGNAGRVTKLSGKSQSVLPTLPSDSFDAIYIDGGHSEQEVLEDARESWRLARGGAVLIFDDYLWGMELPVEDRPLRAIARFLVAQAGGYLMKSYGYQVIIERRG